MRPQSHINYYAYIDLLRGIAVLGVILVHSYQRTNKLPEITQMILDYPRTAMQLFFMISSVTLCLSMAQRKEKSLWNFYIRRYFRIAPLYYFGIVFYFFCFQISSYLAIEKPSPVVVYTPQSIIENLFFVHGFDHAHYNNVVPGGWSIATEMVFYSIFPALYYLMNKVSLHMFIALGAGMIIPSLAVQYAVMWYSDFKLSNDSFGLLNASILTQFFPFMIGMVTYRLLDRAVTWRCLPVAAAFVGMSFYVQNFMPKTGFNGFIAPILSSIPLAYLIIWLSRQSHFKNPLVRLIIRIGEISYSMYLLHFVCLWVIKYDLQYTLYHYVTIPEMRLLVLYLLTVAVTYCAATITHHLIELPGIRQGKRYMKREARTS